MVIEHKWSLWKGSPTNPSRIRRINEKNLLQSHQQCRDLRGQLTIVENELVQLVQRLTPIDFAQIDQKLHASILLCQTEAKRTRIESRRIKKHLIELRPKLIIGQSYLRARLNWKDVPLLRTSIPKLNRKSTRQHRWRKGIANAYRRVQEQRDREELSKTSEPIQEISIGIQPLPEVEPMFDEVFLPPLPPPPLSTNVSQDIIIPFETPPPITSSRSPPSDRSPLIADDTIVKPHRLMNRTLGNLTQMSFHIDPDLCSSPKPHEKKKKRKVIQLIPPAPAPPQFSSTAIFDSHAFFSQTAHKTKKQKKKIDISRQPIVMSNCENEKKTARRKKRSPYDFQDNDETGASTLTKGNKLLSDDIITARFAKNSHYQSHQTSMGSTKSSRSHHRLKENDDKRKKRKINVLGIGQSSPLTLSNTMNLSPGRLSTDDNDEDFQIQSTLSRRQPRRTRAK